MSDIYIVDGMRKNLRERKKSLENSLCYGAVSDWATFKEIRAQLQEVERTEQDLHNLLKKLGNNEDEE